MLIITGTHVHSNEAYEEVLCVDCLNHVQHSGHFSTTGFHAHDCVLCSLQSLPFLAPVILLVLAYVCRKESLRPVLSVFCVRRDIDQCASRAPPFLFC